ncbi:MAG: hypothetical protein DRG78_18155 [Epsilonproteobacteria bacterium]|nr:MAG: hypothetical protein DRG78_18155 [Campylobacterota bacterium]
MATCELCKLTCNKLHKITSSKDFNGLKACKSCYQNNELHEGQTDMFGTTISFNFDEPLDYKKLRKLILGLGYENVDDFFIEINMNPRSAVQTWKKKQTVPFLAKAYLQSKIDNINKVDIVEIEELKRELELSEDKQRMMEVNFDKIPKSKEQYQGIRFTDIELNDLRLIMININPLYYGKDEDAVRTIVKKIETFSSTYEQHCL